MSRLLVKKSTVLIFLFFIQLILKSSLASAGDHTVEPEIRGGVFAARPALHQVVLTGYTRARRVMDIVSEEAGRCTSVRADIGDMVSKEGVFALLDRTFIDLAIEKNRVGQKRLENIIAYHAKEVRRYKALVSRDTAAQATLDELQNRLDQAQFELQGLRVEQAQLKERRERHVIQVPADWTVTERTVEPGEWISVGRHLGKAGDYRSLLIPFALSPEEYHALQRLNGSVSVYFPDEGEHGLTLTAYVERVSPAFDPETRKVSVDLVISQGLPQMRGGLLTVLTLEVPDTSGAVLVPTSALSQRYEEYWLTRENGQQVRVVLLDEGLQNTSRVRSPDIRPGDIFKAEPER